MSTSAQEMDAALSLC